MFLYYANKESDDIIGGSTKTAQHLIENNSRNIKAVFFKLHQHVQYCAKVMQTIIDEYRDISVVIFNEILP